MTDIAPTVLEVAGVDRARESTAATSRCPLAGTSIAYTFDRRRDAPARKTSQYFEMVGPPRHVPRRVEGGDPPRPRRALRRRPLGALPRRRRPLGVPRPRRRSNPRSSTSSIAVWWREAEAFGASAPRRPQHRALRGRGTARTRRTRRAATTPTDPPLSPIPPQAARAARAGAAGTWPRALIGPSATGGVLWPPATENAGLSLFVQDDRLVLRLQRLRRPPRASTSTREVPDGPSVLGVRFRRGGRDDADVTLTIDGRDVGRPHLPFLMRIISTIGMSVGSDHGSPVSELLRGGVPLRGPARPRRHPTGRHATRAEDRETAAREGLARQ